MALTIGQEKCVNTLGKPLAVSAGAGSGKTFTLTRRIVYALESGYLTDIDQVLAITFTSKAAGEIKSRVKGALRAGGLTEQALKTDEAWISTIHGMSSRILRAHALELGLDPAFKVADEATVKTLLDASLEEVLGGRDDLVTVAEGVSSQRFDALFASFDVHPAGPRTASVEGMVRQLVEAASAHPDGMASLVAPPEAPSPIKLLAQLVDVAETAYALADGVKPGSTRDKFLAATQDALEGARKLIGRGSDGLTYRRALSAMNGFPVPGRNFGKNTPYGEQAVELAEQYCAIAAQARCGLVQEQLATLIDVAKSVADAFARRKREAGCWTTTTCWPSRPARFATIPPSSGVRRPLQAGDGRRVPGHRSAAGGHDQAHGRGRLLAHVHRRRRAAEHLPVPRRGRVGISPPSGGCAPPQPRGHHRAARQLP